MLNKKRLHFIFPLIATLSLHANDPFYNDPFGDNIFKEMIRMQQDMDKMFQSMHQRMQKHSTMQMSPLGTYKIQEKSNFIDKGTQYEYVTNIPESKENEIDIHSANGIVYITAKIVQKKEVQTANGFSSSSSMRMYQQKLALPMNADDKTLNMGYKNGYLVLVVDKIKSKNNITKENNTTKQKEMKKVKDEKIEKIKLSDDTSMS